MVTANLLVAETDRIVGAPSTALAQLDRLVARTGAVEIMATTVAVDLDTRLRSLELLADAWPTRRQESPTTS